MNATSPSGQGSAERPAAGRGRITRQERRGVLLLIVLSMLTLFMMLGAAYLVVATRSRETARAYAKLSLRSDNVRLPHSQLLDTVMLRVLRGAPTQPSKTPAASQIGTGANTSPPFWLVGVADTALTPPASPSSLNKVRFESILADKYGYETLAGTASPSGGAQAVYEAAPLLVLPSVLFDAVQISAFPANFHEIDLVGRVITILGPGRDPSSHRILRATDNLTNGNKQQTTYQLVVDNQPRNRQFELPLAGQTCRIVINGREFTGDGTLDFPNEPWDGFDDQNTYLSWVAPRDLQNESNAANVSVSSSVLKKAGFILSGTTPYILQTIASGTSALTNGVNFSVDNDNDGVNDGYFYDFGLPAVIAPNGDQILLHASVLVVDLDGRVNVNAHGSIAPVCYPQTVTSGTSAFWQMGNLPSGFPAAGAVAVPTGSGYGPAEVNIDLLFPSETSPAATYAIKRLQGATTAGGYPLENPALYLRTGVTSGRLADSANGGAAPQGSRFYSIDAGGALTTTPQLPSTEGRYGGVVATKWTPNNTLSSNVSFQLATPNTDWYTPPGKPLVNDASSAVNDHLSPIDPATLGTAAPRTLGYEGLPPAWWNADGGSTFNWADNTGLTAGAATLPVPRAIYNSPPDLHGRMKTFTVAAATGTGVVPQLCFIKPEWSRNGNLDVETRDDPYEIRLDTRAPRNSWLTTSGTSPPSGNLFNLSELENILRPYDIDSSKLPPRLEALLGSAAEEARLRVTTDSWDTTVITGSAATTVNYWLKNSVTGAVRGDPAKLFGAAVTSNKAQLSGLLNRELARFEKFDLNRPLTGKKPDTYAITDRYYAQRQAYFKDLYILLCALSNDGKAITAAEADRCAQWAANAVEFRDADSTMTPFEYDTKPEDGWDVDGDAKTLDTGGQRKLVFGTERPEMVITETSAWEDGVNNTGELFIMLHRPWNAQAFARLTPGSAASDKSVAAEACDPLFDSYDNAKAPKDQLDLGRKSGVPPLPPNNNDKVSDTATYPIWRLRIDDGAGNTKYVRCDVNSGSGSELVSTTVTDTTTPKLGADGWLCLQGTNSLAGQQVTFTGGAGTVKTATFQNFRAPGTAPASGAPNRKATVYLERLVDPTATPNSTDWTLDPTIAPSTLTAAQLARMAVYRVVDQASIEIVNRTPDALGAVPPTKTAMKTTRKTDVATTSFWKADSAPVASTALGPITAAQAPVWFPWPNRPFVGSPELFLVHGLDSRGLVQNFTNPTLDPAATPDNWTAALLKTLKNPPLLEAVTVPTRFGGIHTTVPAAPATAATNLAQLAGLDLVTTPVNQLSSFREPGRVNLNTVTASDVWNAVVAGPLVKADGSPDPLKAINAAGFGATPARTFAGLLAFSGTASPAPPPAVDTNATLAGAAKLNAAHSIYTATRLANTTTTRSHLFGVWITLRESVTPTGGGFDSKDPDSVRLHRAFYIIDRSIPVAHEPGRDHNVWDAVLLRRVIE